MQRNKFIDIAKGIGICLMVIGHMTGMIPIHKFIYQFHMPMFLIFSGYFFNPQKWQHFLPFAYKRLKQLLIPYICFYIIILYFITQLNPDSNIMTYIFQGPPHAIWFLLTLFLSEILFFCLHKINSHKLFIIIYIIFLIITGKLLSLFEINLPYSLSSVPVCTAFYAIGFFLKEYMNKLIHHQIYIAINYAIISLLLCYCYVIITGYHTELAANNINLTSYFTAILGTLGIIHLSIFVEHKLPLIKTILNWIGQNSICFNRLKHCNNRLSRLLSPSQYHEFYNLQKSTISNNYINMCINQCIGESLFPPTCRKK